MPFAPAPPLPLRAGDKERLEAVLRQQDSDRRDALRAGIILLCAEGTSHRQIKRQLRTSTATIIRWRSRYEARGLAGLWSRSRPGRAAGLSA
jgi:transposase